METKQITPQVNAPQPASNIPPKHNTKPNKKLPKKILLSVALAILLLVLASLLVYKLFSKTSHTNSSQTSTSATQNTHIATKNTVDTTDPFTQKLPLGDGKVSTSAKVGYVDACETSFRGGGAEHAGSWIEGTEWDPTKKTEVQGEVSWPNASVKITVQGDKRVVSANGLPTNSTTGIFPIQQTDPAYQIDRNPNAISAQNIMYTLPKNPTASANDSCIPMGSIGIMTNGVALYNALDAAGRDAAAHEVQDHCDGHPEKTGEYHYHNLSGCFSDISSQLVIGYAWDGFGITGPKKADGSYYKTADLDECHGITSDIMWDGQKVSMYHYVMTADYPYSISCFKGTSVKQTAPARARP